MTKNVDKAYINTTLNADLLRDLKVLAAKNGVRINQLLEEAILDLLKKFEKKSKR